MPKRTLIVTTWLSDIPRVAECSVCGREFEVPIHLQMKAAEEYLQDQFDHHICKAS